jgi:hypothetical protein
LQNAGCDDIRTRHPDPVDVLLSDPAGQPVSPGVRIPRRPLTARTPTLTYRTPAETAGVVCCSLFRHNVERTIP